MNKSIFYEKLIDRDLWVDGTETLNIDAMTDKILADDKYFLENAYISEDSFKEVKNFIDMSGIRISKSPIFKTKDSIPDLDTSFNIPHDYLNMDIEKKLIKAFKNRHDVKSMDIDEKNARLYRLAEELDQYTIMGLFDVLKCAIYIIDNLKLNNIVWGPGRGSACCSYVLYLLEVHDIDSYYYNLSIDEFLR
jgi:DNA polymerase III alpha subunit